MYCKSCRSEYRPGIERCSDCGAELLPGDLPDPVDLRLKEPPPDPVTVFTSRDPALLPVARSILEGEEVPFFVRGEELQDLFGIGRLGLGFNPIVGPIEIQVPAEMAERARELLAAVEDAVVDEPEPKPAEEDDETAGQNAEALSSPGADRSARAGMPLASLRARVVFRSLVAADLIIVLVRQRLPLRWLDELPEPMWDELLTYFGYGALEERIDSLAWLENSLFVVAWIGLLRLSPWARSLYTLLLCWSFVSYCLGGPTIDYGLDSSLRLLGRLLAGAIVALAFYGPIAEVFAEKKAARRRRRRHRATSPG